MKDTWMYESLRVWARNYPRLSAPLRFCKGLLLLLVQALRFFRFLATYVWLSGRSRIPTKARAESSPEIVMMVWSTLTVDPRVEREARALVAAGYRVKILCPELQPPAPMPDWGPGIDIKEITYSATHTLENFPWVVSTGMLDAALAENPWAYHAHDLNMAMTALAAADAKGVLCVCDFHEWYSENVSYDPVKLAYVPHSPLKRWIYQLVEKLVLKRASRVITVCDSIAGELAQMHPPTQPVAVIRNIPPRPKDAGAAPTIDLRKLLNVPAEKAILLYQGGLGPTRALEPLLQAMGKVRHAVLVIRGPGMDIFGPEYQRLAQASGAGGSVFCLPPVKSDRCVAEAKSADIGFWSLLPLCKNFTYALPNKIFEYLTAGLPLVCANHPEVARVVANYGVGRCFDPADPDSIAAAIDFLAGNAIERARCRANISRALEEMQADREWEKMVALYRDLQEPPTIPAVKAAA
jgi:glycosyltransferase involved in cell wall biosynthesis